MKLHFTGTPVERAKRLLRRWVGKPEDPVFEGWEGYAGSPRESEDVVVTAQELLVLERALHMAAVECEYYRLNGQSAGKPRNGQFEYWIEHARDEIQQESLLDPDQVATPEIIEDLASGRW